MTQSLLASCWTSAGDASPDPGRDVSPHSLRSRIEATAHAGFVGMGLFNVDLLHFLETSDFATLRQILQDNGIETVELEFLANWWMTGAPREESDQVRRLLLTAAQELGASTIKTAASLDGSEVDFHLLASELHQLGADASEHGTTIGLEFMAFTNIPTLSKAMELIRAADHPCIGLEIDAWHIDRCHTTMEELATVPLSAIMGVELDDGLHHQTDDAYRDTVDNRMIPGRGEFPLIDLVNTLVGIGWQGPWGVEILSAEYRTLDVAQALAETADATFALLADAERERGARA